MNHSLKQQVYLYQVILSNPTLLSIFLNYNHSKQEKNHSIKQQVYLYQVIYFPPFSIDIPFSNGCLENGDNAFSSLIIINATTDEGLSSPSFLRIVSQSFKNQLFGVPSINPIEKYDHFIAAISDEESEQLKSSKEEVHNSSSLV